MPKRMSNTTPKRILFIRPSALGDVCRSVPVVASLKKQWPAASIDWLVQSEFVEAVSAHPAIEEVIPFQRKDLKRWYFPAGFCKLLWFLKELKSKKYDLVIDGQGLGRSGLFSWATRSPRRIGLASAREFGWLGYTQRVQAGYEHTVDKMLALSEAAGAQTVRDMQLATSDADREWCEHLELHQYAVLAPTSRWESKQWPITRFVEVAKHLLERGLHVVVVGAPSETNQIEQLVQLDGVLNLLPEMTIGRLMAVIENSRIVIANDSAALHIAVGFDRTCIGLFGPTNPAVVGPYQQHGAVIAATVNYDEVHYRDLSLGDHIMRQIRTQEVKDKIDELIGSPHE